MAEPMMAGLEFNKSVRANQLDLRFKGYIEAFFDPFLHGTGEFKQVFLGGVALIHDPVGVLR